MSSLKNVPQDLVERFRRRVYDTDPLKNILNYQQLEFTDDQIKGYIIEGFHAINDAEPRTSYRFERFPNTTLLLDAAMIYMFQAMGLLHLRNQISYNDAGFSVNLDDKSGHYAQWLNQKYSMYMADLKQFKRSRIPRFRGVHSPMGWWG